MVVRTPYEWGAEGRARRDRYVKRTDGETSLRLSADSTASETRQVYDFSRSTQVDPALFCTSESKQTSLAVVTKTQHIQNIHAPQQRQK
jgi:hypothetical protein